MPGILPLGGSGSKVISGWLVLVVVLLGADSLNAQTDPLVLSLDRAIELGFENDEALRQAAREIEGAQGEVTAARSAALPQITISAQYGRNLLKPVFFLPEEFREDPDAPAKVEIGEDNEFMGTAAVTQLLWAAGRVSAGLNAAREYLEATRYGEIAARDFVRFRVQEAYFGVLLADEMLRITEKALHDAEEAVRVARVGFDQGTVSNFDVMRAEVELANRRPPLVSAQNDLEQAVVVLRRRCGIESHVEMSLSDSLTAVELPENLDIVMAAMREASADIKALEHYVSANQYFLRLTKAERYPTLQLSANYSVQSQWSKNFIPDSDLIAQIAGVQLGLHIPIFDGKRTKGRSKRAEADLRVAELELEKVTRDKELAVRQSYLTLENSITALEGRQEAVELAEEAYRLSVVRLENGLATPLERLDAELAMITARGQLAQALYVCKLSEAYLELAVGSDGFLKVVEAQ
jgi:outer membrane protein TolC